MGKYEVVEKKKKKKIRLCNDSIVNTLFLFISSHYIVVCKTKKLVSDKQLHDLLPVTH